MKVPAYRTAVDDCIGLLDVHDSEHVVPQAVKDQHGTVWILEWQGGRATYVAVKCVDATLMPDT